MTLECPKCGSEHDLEKIMDLGCQDYEEHACLVCGTEIYAEKVAASFRLKLVRKGPKAPEGG